MKYIQATIFNFWNNCVALYFVLSVPDKMIKDRISFFHEILRDWIADTLNISLRMAKVLTICILPIRNRPHHFHKLIVFLIDSRIFQLKVQFFSFFGITTKINTKNLDDVTKIIHIQMPFRERSKAFSKSMAAKVRDISLFIVCSITSSIVLMASKIVLPLTKALWSKWIISGSTFSNRLAKILDANSIFAFCLFLSFQVKL